jgi:hypothetical protein
VREKDKNGILLVQDPNEVDKLLTHGYMSEALTTPEVINDTVFVAADKLNDLALAQPGTISLVSPGSLYIVDILREEKRVHRWVARYDMHERNESNRLQPGKYLVIYKPKSSYNTEDTRSQTIVIEENRTLIVNLP